MANYVISKRFVEYVCKTNGCEKYINNVLLPFIQENLLKVIVDKDKRVLNYYYSCITNDSNLASKDVILFWLENMDRFNKFEPIATFEVDDTDSEDESFLKLSRSAINNRKIIIDSHLNWTWAGVSYINGRKNCIIYGGSEIIAYDKDEAIIELKNANSYSQEHTNMIIPDNNSGFWQVFSKMLDAFSKKEIKIIFFVLIIGGLACLHYNFCQSPTVKTGSDNIVRLNRVSISGTLKLNGEIPPLGIISNVGITGDNGVSEVSPDVDGGFKLKNVTVPPDEEISIELVIKGKSYSKLVGVYEIDTIKRIAKVGELRIEIPKENVRLKNSTGKKSEINITINQIKTSESSPEIIIQK